MIADGDADDGDDGDYGDGSDGFDSDSDYIAAMIVIALVLHSENLIDMI